MKILEKREVLKLKIDSLSDAEVLEVMEYISIMEALHAQNGGPDPLDEILFRLLAEARERVPQDRLRQ